MNSSTDLRPARVTKAHVDRWWRIGKSCLKLEGWCHRESDSVANARLVDGSGCAYRLLSLVRLVRKDVNLHLGIVDGRHGFALCFEQTAVPAASGSRGASGGRVDKDAADKLQLYIDFVSGHSVQVDVRSGQEQTPASLHLSSEIDTLDEGSICEALLDGAKVAPGVKFLPFHVDSVLRFGEWLLIKGWASDRGLDLQRLAVRFRDDRVGTRRLFAARYHRPDIPPRSGTKTVGNRFGFAILLETGGAASEGKLVWQSERDPASDAIAARERAVAVVHYPGEEAAYMEFLAGVIDALSHADRLARPYSDLERLLQACLSIEDEIDYACTEQSEAPTSLPALSIVLNLVDRPADALYGFFANSDFGCSEIDAVYVCIQRLQFDARLARDIDKIAYLFGVRVELVIYGSTVTQAKIARDAARFVRTERLMFTQVRSAVNLSNVVLDDTTAVLPAIVCSRVGRRHSTSICIAPDRAVSGGPGDGAAARKLPPFFGSIFTRKLIEQLESELYSLSAVEFISAVDNLVPNWSSSVVGAAPEYAAYELYDDGETLIKLYNTWHTLESVRPEALRVELNGA